MDKTSRYFEKIFLNLGLMEASRMLSTVLIFLNARAFRKSKYGNIFSMIFEFDVVRKYHGGSIMLAIRISHEIESRLQQLAQKTGRTKTYYAREALLRFLEDMEDEYLALSRIESPTKRWTLDELEQGVDLEN